VPIYIYKGYDASTGANRKGEIDAESERAARQKLRQRFKVNVSELREQANISSRKKGSFQLFSPRVSLGDLSVMTRQFATLQEAHVPLDESLKALISQVESKVLSSTLSAVKDLVSEGKSLAEASSQFPTVFNRLYVNMVRAGESSGTLGTVLLRLADFLEYQVKVRGQVVSAVTYPAIMILSSSALVSYLFVSVVPKLTKVFSSLKVTIPWYTQVLIKISDLIQQYWYLGLMVGIGIGMGFRRWVSTPEGRLKFDDILLKLPLFGQIFMRISISRFTKTLATLLTSGVPIIQALEITKNVVTNVVIANVLEQAKVEVQEGKSLAACIDRSGRFPGLVTHMIATGEKTGQLEEMLVHVANAYDAEVQRKISTMISLIEPAMMLIMFSIAGVVIVAMMLPMLSVMNQLR